MIYVRKWQKSLNKKESIILIILFTFILLFYEYILFSRVSAERYFNKALVYFNKANSVVAELLVTRSICYQSTLKLLKKSSDFNPYDSRPYFEYAEALSEILIEPELVKSLDMRDFGGKEAGEFGFYNLAKIKYTQAILKEPANAIYHLKLGAIYVKLLDPEKAEKEFNNSVLFDPQNIRIRLYLSRYFLLNDKKEIALVHLNKAISLYKIIPRSILSDEVENFVKAIGQEELLREK